MSDSTKKTKRRKPGRPKGGARTLKELKAAGSSQYNRIRAEQKRNAGDRRRDKLAKRIIPPTPSAKRIEQYCRGLIPEYDPWRDAGSEYVFDPKLAREKIRFWHKHFTHLKGPKAEQAFELEPWQQAIVGNIFGWVDRETGMRRYTKANIFIPQKNGKTPLAAGLAVLLYLDEDEPGSECYCLAWSLKQAMLVFEWARGIVLAESHLFEQCQVQTREIKRLRDGEIEVAAHLNPIAAEDEAVQGINAHSIVSDELHTWKAGMGSVFDTLQKKMAARRMPRQGAKGYGPLMVNISTAGWDKLGVLYPEWELSRRVRDGAEGFENPRLLPVIYETLPEEDWKAPKVWAKCNPGMNVTFPADLLKEECAAALLDPEKEANFKRLILNMWTAQRVRYFSVDAWDACPDHVIDDDYLRGRTVYAGIDGSMNTDLTSLVICWREADGFFGCRSWSWIPEDVATERNRMDRIPYLLWQSKGYIELTPGATIDLGFVSRRIRALQKLCKVDSFWYDPAKIQHWVSFSAEALGGEWAAYPQVAQKMNEPTGFLKQLVMEGKLRHGGDPVLRWSAENAERQNRSDELVKLVKPAQSSPLKVDPIQGLIMALAKAMSTPEPKKKNFDIVWV